MSASIIRLLTELVLELDSELDSTRLSRVRYSNACGRPRCDRTHTPFRINIFISDVPTLTTGITVKRQC